jgi:AP-4 complex subunit sigma-1
MEERSALESEIIRKCLSRSELQCSFLEYRGYKVIYRRYASLFFIAGTKPDGDDTENSENELGMLEFIHTLVETMDKWAGSICGTCPYLFLRAAFVLVPLALPGYFALSLLRRLWTLFRPRSELDIMYQLEGEHLMHISYAVSHLLWLT